jgi:hypothetical protein
MGRADDDILVQEIGKLAGLFGGFGARAAAKRLPTEEYQALIELDGALSPVREKALQILRREGRILDQKNAEHDSLSAVVGSGHLNLNPTIIHVKLSATSAERTQLSLRGVAKEGLLKQDSARRAVEKITALLSDRDA